MDRCLHDQLSEGLNNLYQKLEDAFSYKFSDEDIQDLKRQLDRFETKLEQIDELDDILLNVHNQIVDLQKLHEDNKPEEEDSIPSLEHITSRRIVSSSSNEEESSSSNSSESSEKKSREKLPFAFLRSISNSAYTRYYTAYKEAKSLIKKLNEENPDEIWTIAEEKIQTHAPDPKTLYSNLKEVYNQMDTIVLTQKYGKPFVRFHKIFQKMCRIALTYSSLKK